MLEHARRRGLDVREGSATDLPFGDATFDVTCSFKVLAHVPDVDRALTEMARVTRPGGFILAEFYNPNSVRGVIKRLGPARRIASGADEGNVYTRFHSPDSVRALVPPGCELVGARGVRIVTPAAAVMRVPVLRRAFREAERVLCDSPLAAFGGFYIAAISKR
jgi:SAM-dependent methyltransferase